MHRNKKIISVLILLFASLIVITGKGNRFNFAEEPSEKYRAEHATPTGHTIIIDEHFRVETLSAGESLLIYSKHPYKKTESADRDQVFSVAVDQFNWNENYIFLSARGSGGDHSYMIVNRKTLEAEGYKDEKSFEQEKKNKQIHTDLKSKEAFDWY